MEHEEAKKVLELLAKGISPETGELLANDGPFNEPRVIRALYFALGLFGSTKGPAESKNPPAQAGKPWPPEEDERLLKSFDSAKALGSLQKRTVAPAEQSTRGLPSWAVSPKIRARALTDVVGATSTGNR